MRTPLLLVACTLAAAPLFAQPLFHRALAASMGEVHAVGRAADGHTFVASTVAGTGDPNWIRTGIHVVKYGTDYTAVWSQVLRNPVTNGDLDVHGLTATADGGVALVGRKYLSITDSVLVVKLNSAGAVSWARIVPVPLAAGQSLGYYTQGADVAEAANGDLIVTGTLAWAQGLSQSYMGFAARFDAAGTLLWSRTLESGGSTEAYDVTALPGGGIGVLGRTGSAPWLARLQDDGTVQWTMKYPLQFGQYASPAHRLFPTASGYDLLLSTGSVHASLGCLVHTDATGTFTGATVYHVPGTASPWSADITAAPGGGYLLLGYAWQADDPNHWTDMHVLRIGTDDAVQWSVALGAPNSETGLAIASAADGGALVGGIAYYHDLADYRGIAPTALLVRVGGDGAFVGCGHTTTATATDTLLTSAEHTLASATLPNWAPTTLNTSAWSNERMLCTATAVDEVGATPFVLAPNPASTVLRISPTTAVRWQHQLLDATGRTVLQHPAATGAVDLDVSALAPGRYTLRSTAGDVVQHTAMLVVR